MAVMHCGFILDQALGLGLYLHIPFLQPTRTHRRQLSPREGEELAQVEV